MRVVQTDVALMCARALVVTAPSCLPVEADLPALPVVGEFAIAPLRALVVGSRWWPVTVTKRNQITLSLYAFFKGRRFNGRAPTPADQNSL